jgi:dTDP-4-amino-4,6-dideoxygalactose transaminase
MIIPVTRQTMPATIRPQEKIPFSPPYIDDQTIMEVMDTLNSGWITSGPKVRALEEICRHMSACEDCACVNSWTSGALLTLKWWGIKPGDEVIVPAYTYAATALAAMHAGAKVVMVDVLDDCTMNPEKLSEAITPQTKAIIPVDVAGWPCDYEAIKKIVSSVEAKRLFQPANEVQEKLGRTLVVSDAAHSIGAKIGRLPAAWYSDVTIYSFHAVKNITTAEGGAICLNLPEPFNNREVYRWMKLNSICGQSKDSFSKTNLVGEWRYDILSDGLKVNMPDICAAIGLSQMRQYESFLLPQRRRVFERYNKRFEDFDWAQLPAYEDKDRSSSCHVYGLRIKDITESQRDEMIQCISENNVSVNVHFIPLPMLTFFKKAGFDIADFQNSFGLYSREISLPVYPQLTNEQIDLVVENVAAAYEAVS